MLRTQQHSQQQIPTFKRTQLLEQIRNQRNLSNIINCAQINELKNTCDKCNENYYLAYGNKSCIECDQQCRNCSQGSNLNCSSCVNSYLYPNLTCGLCTEPGFYQNNGDCVLCSYGCKKCDQNGCIECNSSFFLYQNRKCGLCTEIGFYQNQNTCLQCHQSCKTCFGNQLNNCWSCQPHFSLQLDGTCMIDCDINNGYFIQDVNCQKCDQSCKTCNGVSNTNCLTCSPGLYLYENNSCQVCNKETGYYIQGQRCIKCDKNCQTCDENPKKCLTCPLNQYLTCTATCDTSKGFFNQDNKCLACDPSCLTCSGSTIQECLTCGPNQFLQSENQKSTVGSCKPCDESCAKCKGPSNKDCLACSKNYILLPSIGKCALCEEGYFFSQNNCEQCNEMCITCSGKNQNECIDCRGGLIQSSITKTCQQSSQIENEKNQIGYSKIIGCYNQTDQQVVTSCLDQIEISKSSTQNLDTLAVINLSLIVASSIFTPIGSSLGWIFIQNQQLLGNYIFAYKLGPMWMNQLEIKMSYAHHLFTLIPNIFTLQANKEEKLFQFNKFSTLFPINDFWNSYLNNCINALLEFLYLIIITFVSVIMSQEYSINSYDVSELNINMRKAYRFAMYVYIGVSICVQAFILLQKAWNYIKMLKQIQNSKRNGNSTSTCNIVEQITDSNLDKLFEMLDQSKSNVQFGWKNHI